jgi:hypothetical protein
MTPPQLSPASAPAARLALASAQLSLEAVDDLIRTIESDQISMDGTQKIELIRFVRAYQDELRKSLPADPALADPGQLSLILVRESELNQALAFIQSAFISPRHKNPFQQILEAADWLSIEIWQRSHPPANSPIGPIVAVDSRRSPAVWVADAALPMPSFFQRTPDLVSRGTGNASDKSLTWFPLICMPTVLTRMPEFLPLLAHEVGHAIDDAQGLSRQVLEKLPESSDREYWQAWIREMLADLIGLMESGEAFLLALNAYLKFMSTSNSVSRSCSYPPVSLRFAFLTAAVHALGRRRSPALAQMMFPAVEGLTAKRLQLEFTRDVLPVMLHVIDAKPEAWLDEQKTLHRILRTYQPSTGHWPPRAIKSLQGLRFSLIPSLYCLLALIDGEFSTTSNSGSGTRNSLTTFRTIHALRSERGDQPTGFQNSSQWQFSVSTLPALRATVLAANGMSKIPPAELLIRYERIAFVGATNSQLADKLHTAFAARNRQPWSSLEFFFLEASELPNVERESDPPATREELHSTLVAEQDRSIAELKALVAEGVAESAVLYRYTNRTMLFGAWYDCDKPGGRIHISTQLHGTDLRKCPSQDLVWHDSVPTAAFAQYVRHLQETRRRSIVIYQFPISDPES